MNNTPQTLCHNTRLFNCTKCGYRTDRKNNLKRHLLTMHERSLKPLECCGLAFPNKSSLKSHVAECHNGLGYSCQVCGRSFSRKALMKRHAAIHTDRNIYNWKEQRGEVKSQKIISNKYNFGENPQFYKPPLRLTTAYTNQNPKHLDKPLKCIEVNDIKKNSSTISELSTLSSPIDFQQIFPYLAWQKLVWLVNYGSKVGLPTPDWWPHNAPTILGDRPLKCIFPAHQRWRYHLQDFVYPNVGENKDVYSSVMAEDIKYNKNKKERDILQKNHDSKNLDVSGVKSASIYDLRNYESEYSWKIKNICNSPNSPDREAELSFANIENNSNSITPFEIETGKPTHQTNGESTSHFSQSDYKSKSNYDILNLIKTRVNENKAPNSSYKFNHPNSTPVATHHRTSSPSYENNGKERSIERSTYSRNRMCPGLHTCSLCRVTFDNQLLLQKHEDDVHFRPALIEL